MTNINNNTLRILFIIFSIFTLFISYRQMSYFHWSTILDQDIMITYNSILMASGYEQEYRDHPAYTTFFINAFLIKFFSLFGIGPIPNINEIINLENPHQELQKLYFFCRYTNVLFNILLVYFLFKVLKEINFDNLTSSLCCLILIFCGNYTESFFFLRSENLSILFFLVSLLFQIKFLKNRQNFMIIFSGIFFGFAMLAKIQIIFLFGMQILIYLFFFNKKIKENNINSLSKKFDTYLIFIYFIIFFSYFVLQIKLQTFDRFEKIRYLDLTVFFISNIFYLFLCLMLTNFKLNKVKIFFVYLTLFFIGYILSITITLIFDLINLMEISQYILLRLTNPIHYMAEHHMINLPILYSKTIISFEYFYDLFFIAISKYHYNFIKLISLFLIMSVSIYFDFTNSLKVKYINKILMFLGTLSIIYILNLRDGNSMLWYYETYVVVPYVIVLGYYLKNFPKKISITILIPLVFYFLYCNIFLLEKRYKNFDYYFSKQSSMKLICGNGENFLPDLTYRNYIKYYNNKFDDKFIDKLCSISM